MRIDSKSAINRPAATSKSKGTRKNTSDFSKSLDPIDQVYEPTAVSGAEEVTAVDALISVQQVNKGNSLERDWVRHWGNRVLSDLSRLREALLMGDIPAERLERLVQSLDARKDSIDDPNLRQVVDEIELRGRIEVAKYQRSL